MMFRKLFLSLLLWGSVCSWVQANQLYIGHLWARPVTVNMHDIYVHYWLQGGLEKGTIYFDVDYGRWDHPEHFRITFPSIYRLLEDATYNMNHCCSLSIPFRDEQNAITYRKYLETMGYVSLGSRCQLEGCYLPDEIAKLHTFKELVLDKLALIKSNNPEKVIGPVWYPEMPESEVSTLLYEYNLGMGFVMAARRGFGYPDGEINGNVKHTCLKGAIYSPDPRFVLAGVVGELSQAGIYNHKFDNRALGIIRDALNVTLERQVHLLIKHYMQHYLSDKLKVATEMIDFADHSVPPRALPVSIDASGSNINDEIVYQNYDIQSFLKVKK